MPEVLQDGNTDARYWAGLIDGDGVITLLLRQGVNVTPTIGLSSITLEVLEEFISIYGGYIYKKKRTNPRARQAYTAWLYGSERCKRFLKDVIPYLKIKRTQAELVLSVAETIGGPGEHLPNETKVLRFKILEHVRALNKRGA